MCPFVGSASKGQTTEWFAFHLVWHFEECSPGVVAVKLWVCFYGIFMEHFLFEVLLVWTCWKGQSHSLLSLWVPFLGTSWNISLLNCCWFEVGRAIKPIAACLISRCFLVGVNTVPQYRRKSGLYFNVRTRDCRKMNKFIISNEILNSDIKY